LTLEGWYLLILKRRREVIKQEFKSRVERCEIEVAKTFATFPYSNP
jgi:hypothetical protein